MNNLFDAFVQIEQMEELTGKEPWIPPQWQ
jgi:hypothetical protein